MCGMCSSGLVLMNYVKGYKWAVVFFFDLLGYGWVAVGFIFNWIGSSKHGGFNSGEWVTVFKTNVGLKNQT